MPADRYPQCHVQKCADTEPAFVCILQFYSISRALEKCITVYGNKKSSFCSHYTRPKCADSVMNIGLSTNYRLRKTVVKPSFGPPFLSLHSLSHLFAAIQTYGLPGEVEWTIPLHSSTYWIYFQIVPIHLCGRKVKISYYPRTK